MTSEHLYDNDGDYTDNSPLMNILVKIGASNLMKITINMTAKIDGGVDIKQGNARSVAADNTAMGPGFLRYPTSNIAD